MNARRVVDASRAFADEWDAIENENKTIGFETADWVPL
jgi:hypothetical protein